MSGDEGGIGLIGRIIRFWERSRTGGAGDEKLRGLIDDMVEIADPVIRRARRYHMVLHDPIVEAMGYCASAIDAVPGPILVNRERYFDDPRVKALFVSADELHRVVHASPEVQALKQGGYGGEAVALLTMAKEEKTVFGHQMQGEMVMRDVAQRTVNFVDHRVVAPAVDLAAARAGIVNRGLELLATVAMERITNLRSKGAELREKREYLKGAIRILGGRSRIQARFTIPDPSMAEELTKAEQALAAVESELETVTKALGYPEDSLRYLDDVMQNPSDVLTVQSQTLNLNWMNVLVDRGPDGDGREVPLALFSLTSELQRYGVFISFPLEEGAG